MEKDHISKKLSQIFRKYRKEILFAYLFGSVAEGSQTVLSDVDIAVYTTSLQGFELKERLTFQSDCCRALGRDDVDVVVLNQARNLILMEEIIRNGYVILDQDPDRRIEFEVKILHQTIDFRLQRKAMIGV